MPPASAVCLKPPVGGSIQFGCNLAKSVVFSKTAMRSSCAHTRGRPKSLLGSALANVAGKSRFSGWSGIGNADPQEPGFMPMTTFRQLVASEKPLVLPGAHDAISARLIRRAGFKAYFIGGFPTIGARWGLPDIGLVAFGEISAAVADIVAASDLPVMVDGDNGYGDVKNIVHVLHSYERLGVSAIMFEDQVADRK